MVGETGGPTGVIWGYSGAPVVDREGQVIGVLTGADFRGRTKLNLGAIQEVDAEGRPQRREVTLPNRSLVVVQPLQAPEILRELPPSTGYEKSRQVTEVVIAGFPFASCAATSAHLFAADSEDGARLLRKWQLLDQVGAWWLPFASRTRKLRLAPG